MILLPPEFWTLVQQQKGAPAAAVASITPNLPNADKAILQPKLRALIEPVVQQIRMLEIESGRPSGQRRSDHQAHLEALNMSIQSYGARLAQAVEQKNLAQAAAEAEQLAKLMDACGGGSICPVHEPALLRFLEMVEEAAETQPDR